MPACLTVRVLLEQGQYTVIQEDLEKRVAYNPLAESNALESLEPPPEGLDHHEIMEWFASNYPMEEIEAEKFGRLISENTGLEIERFTDYKGLPASHWGGATLPEDWRILFQSGGDRISGNVPGSACLRSMASTRCSSARRESTCWHLHRLSTLSKTSGCRWGMMPIEMVPVMADLEAILAAVARNRGKGALAQVSNVDVGELSLSENTNLVEIDPIEMSRVNPQNPNNTPEQLIHWIIVPCGDQPG